MAVYKTLVQYVRRPTPACSRATIAFRRPYFTPEAGCTNASISEAADIYWVSRMDEVKEFPATQRLRHTGEILIMDGITTTQPAAKVFERNGWRLHLPDDMALVIPVADLLTVEKLVVDVGFSGGGQQRRQPVLMRHNIIENRAGFDFARPAHEEGHAPAPFPVSVLFAAKRSDPGVRPTVVVRSVICRIHYDGVIGDAQLIELSNHFADILIVRDHHVVIKPLSALAPVLFGAVGPEMHRGGVVPEEKGLAVLVRLVHEIERMFGNLVIDSLHALSVERTRVLDLLSAAAIRPTVDYTLGPKRFLNSGSFG
jgi:hypothetical protein